MKPPHIPGPRVDLPGQLELPAADGAEMIEGLGQYRVGKGSIVTDWHNTSEAAWADYYRLAGLSSLAGRRAAAPMRPTKPQKACDHGLFSDGGDQLDLVEMSRKTGD